MKVAYSVATNLGGSGIGTTSYMAVRGIHKEGNLEKVFCSSFVKREVPIELIYSTNSSFIEGLRFIPSKYQWFIKDNLHDFITSLNVFESDVFHGWNGHSLYSLRRFKKLGALCVIERASSHPTTQKQLLQKEYQKNNLVFSDMIAPNYQKLTKEFEETDYITVPSEFAYQSMVENGVKEKKLKLLSFGVDTDLFKPKKHKSDTFTALFVGQVTFRKGVLSLLRGWTKLKLKQAKLKIVGQIDQAIRPFLTDYIKDPSIEFVGFAPVLPLYQSSDIFIFPSLEEGSALVNYEAMACGLPVITTFESGSIVENNKEGFIIPSSNPEAIAQKIEYLYNHSSKAVEMGERGYKKALQNSWDSYGTRLNDFYRSIL